MPSADSIATGHGIVVRLRAAEAVGLLAEGWNVGLGGAGRTCLGVLREGVGPCTSLSVEGGALRRMVKIKRVNEWTVLGVSYANCSATSAFESWQNGLARWWNNLEL